MRRTLTGSSVGCLTCICQTLSMQWHNLWVQRGGVQSLGLWQKKGRKKTSYDRDSARASESRQVLGDCTSLGKRTQTKKALRSRWVKRSARLYYAQTWQEEHKMHPAASVIFLKSSLKCPENIFKCWGVFFVDTIVGVHVGKCLSCAMYRANWLACIKSFYPHKSLWG